MLCSGEAEQLVNVCCKEDVLCSGHAEQLGEHQPRVPGKDFRDPGHSGQAQLTPPPRGQGKKINAFSVQRRHYKVGFTDVYG